MSGFTVSLERLISLLLINERTKLPAFCCCGTLDISPTCLDSSSRNSITLSPEIKET